MKKAIFAVVFTLACLIILADGAAVYYVFFLEHSAKSLYSHRSHDTDKDGIPDFDDPDVDGDGLPNMLDDDSNGNGMPNTAEALKYAKKLIGRPYDQFNEFKESPMTKYGAIVCIDVVLYGYERAGIYFEKEMRDHYKKHPKTYPKARWNTPEDKFFARRVRNFRPYCAAHGFILEKDTALQPGDLVIFSRGHIAMIEKVKGDDYITIESSSKKIITRRTKKADIIKRSKEKYGDDVVYARITFGNKKAKPVSGK